MTFETVQLHSCTIATVYKNVLIEQRREKIVEQKTETKKNILATLQYNGGNKKNITILVNEKTAPFIATENLQLLTAILKACKLSIDDVAIVNTHKQNIDFAILCATLSPKMLLLLGVEVTTIGLPTIPLYQPSTQKNIICLSAAALETMQPISTNAKAEKAKLWVALQHFFKF